MQNGIEKSTPDTFAAQPDGKEKRMERFRYLCAAVAVFAALSLPLWLTPDQVVFKGFGTTEVLRLLASPLLIALLLERTLEVFVTTWRGPLSDDLKLEVKHSDEQVSKLQHEKDQPKELADALATRKKGQQALTVYKCRSRQYAQWLSLMLGILVSAVGIRTLEPLIEPDTLGKLAGVQISSFHMMDVLLTGGLIAGGSEVVHRSTQVYTSFMQETEDRVKGKSVRRRHSNS
jgi:hypothetical protein